MSRAGGSRNSPPPRARATAPACQRSRRRADHPQACLRHALEHPVDRARAEDRVALRIHDRLPGANQSEHVGLERDRLAGFSESHASIEQDERQLDRDREPDDDCAQRPAHGHRQESRRDQDRGERDCRQVILTWDERPGPDQERQIRAEEQEHERLPDAHLDAHGVPHERSSPAPREQHQRRCRQTGRKLVGRIEARCQVVPHRAVQEGPHGAPRHEERRHERGRHDESAHCRGARAQQSPPRTSPRGNEPQREARRDREGAYQQDRLQRDRCRRPQHETEREAAPDARRPVDRDQDRGEPEHRPQHIGAVLQRTEEEERIEPCQHGAPRTHPRSEQPAADQGRQEQGCAPLRKHEEAHPEDGRGPLAHREQHRGAEQVEERHVIVEDVAIRQQSVRPRPHHVEVLGLVGVDPKAPRHRDTQRESEHQERRQAHALEAPRRERHRGALRGSHTRRRIGSARGSDGDVMQTLFSADVMPTSHPTTFVPGAGGMRRVPPVRVASGSRCRRRHPVERRGCSTRPRGKGHERTPAARRAPTPPPAASRSRLPSRSAAYRGTASRR